VPFHDPDRQRQAMVPSFTGSGALVHFSTLVMPLARRMTHTPVETVGEPIHSNFSGSKAMPSPPSRCCVIRLPWKKPTVMPSGRVRA
jgi:hypothetical protein